METMPEEKMIPTVFYICPHCSFEMWDSVEALRAQHNFDGVTLSQLPAEECHGCHCCMVSATKIEDTPAEWHEPWDDEPN